jgi:hypothetical protein
MSNQRQALDLNDLDVESIQVVPADSLDTATDGHGMTELAASCRSLDAAPYCGSCYAPDDADEV